MMMKPDFDRSHQHHTSPPDDRPERPAYAPIVVLALFLTLVALYMMTGGRSPPQPGPRNAEAQLNNPQNEGQETQQPGAAIPGR